MISSIIGILISLWMLGMTLHFVMLMWQLFFGHDARQPFDNSSRISVRRQRKQWWDFVY